MLSQVIPLVSSDERDARGALRPRNGASVRAIQAEQNPADARLVRKLLGGSFHLDWHPNPQSALERLTRQIPDVVLVGAGRFDLSSWIQKVRAISPSVPVVVLTPPGEASRQAAHCGADELVVKGQVTGAELQEKLWGLVASSRQEMVQSDIHSAYHLQQSFLPGVPAAPEGIDIAARCRPVNRLSGDWFDFFRFKENISFLVADVTGHDLAASLLMATTRAYCRALSSTCDGPGELMSRVNELLCKDVGATRFVTLGMSEFEKETLTLRVVLAGHPPPLRIQRDGSAGWLSAESNLPLGTVPDYHFPGQVYQLERGDVILMYTDGLEDVTDAEGTRFGPARLIESVRAHRYESAEDILQMVHEEILDFAREGRIPDDLTGVVLRIS